jgi:hypothetical protein
VRVILENGEKIKPMEGEFIYGQQEINTRVNGLIFSNMD